MHAAPAAPLIRPVEVGLSWFALLLAFSPVLVDLVRDVPEIPFAASLLLPIPLAIRCARIQGRSPTRPAANAPRGTLLLLAGVILELLGLFTGSGSIARLGLPLAIIGLAFRFRRPSPFVAAFAFGLIPLPTFLYAQTSPVAESLWAELAGGIFQSFGGEITTSGPTVTHAVGRFVFEPYASGLHLAVVLALVGWYSAILRGESLPEAIARALRAAVLSVPCQLLGALVAMMILAQGRAKWAEAWMDHGLWMAVSVVGIARAERWYRRALVLSREASEPASGAEGPSPAPASGPSNGDGA